MRLLLLLLVVAAAAAADACTNHTSCTECYDDSACAWTTNADCTQTCVSLASLAAASTPLSVPWRTRISQTDNKTCSAAESCTKVSGVQNPSFEASPLVWSDEYSVGASLVCDSSCSTGSGDPPLPFAGERFIWFGGFTKNLTGALYQTLTSIPTTATHVSFYAWVSTLDTTTKTSLDLYIDANLVFRLDRLNSATFLKNYHVMEVDVRKYADGEQHTIKFKFQGQYFVGGSVGSIMLDYVELITNPRVGDTDYGWPARVECSTGCPVSYSTDSECDTACNNAQCGYDAGKCEELIKDVDGVCYDNWTPEDRTLPVCSWYSGSTCCLSYATISYVERQVMRARNTTSCNLEAACLANIEKLLCAKCSPNNAEYYAGGVLMVCMKYANEAWKSCSNSYVPDGSGGCVAINVKYTDAADWITQYGSYFFSNTHCFGNQDTGSGSDDGITTPVIIAIVLGSVAIIAIIGATIFAVWWFRVRKKKPAPPPLDVPMSAGAMTMDPAAQMTVMDPTGAQLAMMPGIGMVSEPVVYTDQFGNIIPPDQLVAMDMSQPF